MATARVLAWEAPETAISSIDNADITVLRVLGPEDAIARRKGLPTKDLCLVGTNGESPSRVSLMRSRLQSTPIIALVPASDILLVDRLVADGADIVLPADGVNGILSHILRSTVRRSERIWKAILEE